MTSYHRKSDSVPFYCTECADFDECPWIDKLYALRHGTCKYAYGWKEPRKTGRKRKQAEFGLDSGCEDNHA